MSFLNLPDGKTKKSKIKLDAHSVYEVRVSYGPNNPIHAAEIVLGRNKWQKSFCKVRMVHPYLTLEEYIRRKKMYGII